MVGLSTNPVATPTQHDQERAALALIQHPRVIEAHRCIADRWLSRANASEEMHARFEAAFEELMFSAAMRAGNADPLRPDVSCITRLAHRVDGQRVPGSRWGMDNPDSVDRMIPISGAERYEVRGHVGEGQATENLFTLRDADMATIDILDGRCIHVEADGSYLITVDAHEAAGRPNHMRSTQTAKELHIRDVLLDWGREGPNHVTVERLGSTPTTPTLPLDEQAEVTVAKMTHFADITDKLSHEIYAAPANHFGLVWGVNQADAIRKQAYVAGRFVLEPGQVFVVDVHDGAAEYFTVLLSNIWGTTLDIYDRTGSLNKAQSLPNADGSYTYVIGPDDPGVHNWIDSDGLHEGILALRAAGFPEGGPRRKLSTSGRVIDLADLDRALPGVPRISWSDRATQRVWRQAGYLRRLPEGHLRGPR